MNSQFVVPSPMTLIRRRSVIVILVLGFCLRIALALVPAFPHYTGDSTSYIDPAVNLFEHSTFAMTCDPRCVPTLWHTPGYPFVLGIVLSVLKMPVGAVYVLQALFDTVTTLLVASVGWALGGTRAGILAAAIHALNPFSAVFAGQIMTESLATLLLMFSIYVLLKLSQNGPSRARGSWILAGALLGAAALVRPIFAPLPALLAFAMLDRAHWRRQARGWAVAACAYALIVGPWVGRNWWVTRNGGADDSFHVMGSMFSPFYRKLATPGVERWYYSFEEPFAWDRPREAPFYAKYFLPNEKEQVDRLFEGIRAAGVEVTPQIDAEFDRLARERRATHPFRTIVLPPISKAARLWITPRLGTFGVESARVASFGGRLLFAAALAYNAVLTLVGFGAGIALARRAPGRLVLAVPAFLTIIHLFVMWGCQSRYSVPGVPEITVLATLGLLYLFDRISQRLHPGRREHFVLPNQTRDGRPRSAL